MPYAALAEHRAASRSHHRIAARERTVSRLKAQSAIEQAFIREPGLYSWTLPDPKASPEGYLAQVGLDERPNVRPLLEINLVGHAEEQLNTLYEIHCVLQHAILDDGEVSQHSVWSAQSGQLSLGARSAFSEGGASQGSKPSRYSLTSQGGLKWRCKRRLCEMRDDLHDPLKRALGTSAYYERFGTTRFARRGGLPGTTARLTLWLATLARLVNDGELDRKLVETVIRFLGAPVGSLAPKKRSKRSVGKDLDRLEVAYEGSPLGATPGPKPPSHPRAVADESEESPAAVEGSALADGQLLPRELELGREDTGSDVDEQGWYLGSRDACTSPSAAVLARAAAITAAVVAEGAKSGGDAADAPADAHAAAAAASPQEAAEEVAFADDFAAADLGPDDSGDEGGAATLPAAPAAASSWQAAGVSARAASRQDPNASAEASHAAPDDHALKALNLDFEARQSVSAKDVEEEDVPPSQVERCSL